MCQNIEYEFQKSASRLILFWMEREKKTYTHYWNAYNFTVLMQLFFLYLWFKFLLLSVFVSYFLFSHSLHVIIVLIMYWLWLVFEWDMNFKMGTRREIDSGYLGAWGGHRCIGLLAIIAEVFQVLLYGINGLVDIVLLWVRHTWRLWLCRKIGWNLIRHISAHETLHEFTYQIPAIYRNHTRTVLDLKTSTNKTEKNYICECYLWRCCRHHHCHSAITICIQCVYLCFGLPQPECL